jgi:excinuclease ABC subunit A
MTEFITITGAREHNLKNISVSLPRGKMTVVTGPSGSGKSSLVFDTLYAEGQRRYVESLSGHARRLLTRLPRPDVDVIDGLCPALAVRERSPSRNPRSTVGTQTDIYDYLRVLFSTLGQVHCPVCGEPLQAYPVAKVVQELSRWPSGQRFSVLAPLVRAGEAAPKKLLEELRGQGFVRLRIDDAATDLADVRKLPDGAAIELVIDRLSVRDGIGTRLAEAVELAYRLSPGIAILRTEDGERSSFSEAFLCFEGHASVPNVTPQLFSFNAPVGACPGCEGLGTRRQFVPEHIVPDPGRSLRRGAISAWGKPGLAFYRNNLEKLRSSGVDLDAPWEKLSEADRRLVLDGGGGYEGVLPGLQRRAHEYERRKLAEGGDEERVLEYLEEELGAFMRVQTCPDCQGTRLNPSARAVRLGKESIDRVVAKGVDDVLSWLEGLQVPERSRDAVRPVLDTIRDRLRFLDGVGLGYLSLGRESASLSAGEAQRVHLATQLGARLSGVLYVLDEPTAGLHPADTARLLKTLQALRDSGNTLTVVEHEPQTMLAADHWVELGPGAGEAGGQLVASGSVAELMSDPASLTGQYLSGVRAVPVPETRRRSTATPVRLEVSELNNLRDLSVEFPVAALCCVTGVSGSGKSSLVVQCLWPAFRAKLGLVAEVPPGVRLQGGAELGHVQFVDSTPIGRTARSNPATYLGLLGPVRELFASLPEARARGYRSGRFSFNVKGGRCETCKGEGVQRVSMQLLPDAEIECEVCGGQRYNEETLQVRYRGLNIAELLSLRVDDAYALFEAVPAVRTKLEALRRVGLGYLELGRRSTTLSGGEAQRIKLARDLAQPARKPTLYIFDEPTRGLHFVDVEQLVGVFHQLVDEGHTVIAVEHQLDVIRNADFLVDLGPGSGPEGGRVVAAGTPEELARTDASVTGRYLRAR